MSAHRFLSGAALAVAVATPALAQTASQFAIQAAPQVMSYKLGGTIGETITETAIPFFMVVPIGQRLTLDIGSAFANSKYERPDTSGTTTSSVSGLTDTQLRANYIFGNDFVVLTAGLNLPTGKSTVETDELLAAGRIGNEFLGFPINSMGVGFAGTGGIAIARPFGQYNVGFAASMRHSAEYEPFSTDAGTVRYQPGDEYRARLGVDRTVGQGRVAVGVTYSAFGDDKDATTTYNTGDRILTQAAFSAPLKGADLLLAAWDIARGTGHQGTTATESENIANVSAAVGFHVLSGVIEPNVEFRTWSGSAASGASMITGGLRTRLSLGGLTVSPSAGFSTGSIKDAEGTSSSLTGWRVGIGAYSTF